MLDLVPAVQRNLKGYIRKDDTESTLAAYLADGVQALMYRWDRTYSVAFTAPQTYVVAPDIAERDIRPIILMASIIYRMGNVANAAYVDGDFSYTPHRGITPLDIDREELLSYIGKVRLSRAVVGPMRGYGFVFNTESYRLFLAGGWITGEIFAL